MPGRARMFLPSDRVYRLAGFAVAGRLRELSADTWGMTPCALMKVMSNDNVV